MQIRGLSLVSLLCLAHLVTGQSLRFERFSTEDGLSQNTILCMLQDRKGYLWLGTEDGLNRYNGYKFESYHDLPSDSTSLADDQVWSLVESDDGTLWVGHTKGLSTIDANGRINNFMNEDGLTVFSSFRDRDGTLWFGTAGQGIMHLQDRNLKRYRNQLPSETAVNSVTWDLVSNYVICFLRDRSDRLWVCTRGAGVFQFKEGQFIRPGLRETDKNFFSSGDFWSMVEDESGQLYFGSTKGLAILDSNLENARYYTVSSELSNASRIARLMLQGDRLWIASYGGGLWEFSRATQKFTRYPYSESDTHSISSDIVFSLLLDRQENLWVGTWAAGVNQLSRDAKLFENYCPRSIVFGLAVWEGKTWVGSYNTGLYFADATGGALTFERLALDKEIFINGLGAGKENLWIATDGNGIGKLDSRHDLTLYSRIPGNSNSVQNNLVNAVFEDPRGMIWATTRGSGLVRLNPRVKYGTPGSVTHFFHRESNPASLSHNYAGALLYDATGDRLWVSTATGLSRLDHAAQADSLSSFTNYPGSGINVIFQDTNERLWVGTSQGLFYLEGEKLVPSEQLKGVNVADLRQDERGRLIAATTTGLYLVGEKEQKFFNSRDGLPHDEFNARASAIMPAGRVVLGTTNGITTFHPNEIIDDKEAPQAVINGLRFQNRAYSELDEELRSGVSVTYSPDVSVTVKSGINVIDIDCFSDDFSDPSGNFFQYKLEGFDKEWNWSSPPDHEFSYTNLDPGEYKFMVKACNDAAHCQGKATVVSITVLPPWWRTWWAYGGYAFLLGAAAWGARKTIVNRERLKSRLKLDHLELEKLKELDDFKSKFFANISHEFRTPLTLILGIAEEIESKNGTSGEALQSIRRNGNNLLTLVNQMLDLSRADAGKLELHPQKIRLNEFLRMRVQIFESLAGQKGLSLRQTYPAEEHEVEMDPSLMEKILNNLLSNAVKYTPSGGSVTFKAKLDSNRLDLMVSDTGVGIRKEHLARIFDRFFRVSEESEGTGIGLALTQELVKLHDGTIRVESEFGHGSTFLVQIPIKISTSVAGTSTMAEVHAPAREDIPEFSWSEEEDGKPILLVVEDNEELRNFLKRNLAEEYQVIDTPNAEEGLKKASLTLPDIIITDWMMPGMGDLAFCGAIKSSEATSHIPVIMLTARAGSDSRMEGWEAGADDYLTKPFEMAELRVRVANLVRQREVLREKFAENGFSHFRSDAKVSSLDKTFLEKLRVTLEERHADSSLSVELIAREMGVGRVQLHRKLTALTGHSASDLLRDYRLRRAADLLRKRAGNVSEVAFRVGFENLSYFAKTFKEKFGTTPSAFVPPQG